ncbi:hypothetical protein C7S10_03435 [Nocardioides currus]|uniref:Uncharacterized protein n=1 Tax=Nocardioides currus TaxID=2133958 RepID=A0A2R7Z3J0_9ACTN|nr:hypothetical protein C7S10_03435 [Nocardioides currus]
MRFNVQADGTLEGDDGSAGIFAAALRYVCRMGAQMGALLDVGPLERVSTISTVSVMARVDGIAPDLSIAAEVDVQSHALVRRPSPVPVPGLTVSEAINRSLRRVTVDLASDWAAVMTDDARVIGAVHDESAGHAAPAGLPDVGLRALAVLASLDEPRRESGVRFDFVRGSVLVAALGEHALFSHADRFEPTDVTRTVDAVRNILAAVELRHAPSVTAYSRA